MFVTVVVSSIDFARGNGIICAMIRQGFVLSRTDLRSYRNGMEYVNNRSEIWQLSANQYLQFQSRIPRSYSLRYEGTSVMSIHHFNALCTLESFKQEYEVNPDSRPFYNFWKKFRGDS